MPWSPARLAVVSEVMPETVVEGKLCAVPSFQARVIVRACPERARS
nr:hypothetical protein [Gulosibacter sediminis]